MIYMRSSGCMSKISDQYSFSGLSRQQVPRIPLAYSDLRNFRSVNVRYLVMFPVSHLALGRTSGTSSNFGPSTRFYVITPRHWLFKYSYVWGT